jgi:predicted 3-demethylubiquinone-9 3-methyltransferase (glyoxalase superfamily)
VVNRETQKEVDEYWGKLLGGGKEIECGWLKDKYGLAWQVVATALEKLLQGKDP